MPKPRIKDEFTDLPVSRQRKSQLRREKLGLCVICGKPAVLSSRCLDHYIQNREAVRKRMGARRRLTSCKSYQLEAAAKAAKKVR